MCSHTDLLPSVGRAGIKLSSGCSLSNSTRELVDLECILFILVCVCVCVCVYR